MRRVSCAAVAVMLVGLASCSALAESRPDRAGKTPEQMLADVIRWQQLAEVRESTGEWAYQCFTDRDFDAFPSDTNARRK